MPKYSKRCGRCVSGPSGNNKKFYAMTCVNATLCALIFALDYLNINDTKEHFLTFTIALILTMLIQVLALYVSYQDPGYVDPTTYTEQKQFSFADLRVQESPDELAFFEDCRLYKPRPCQTCQITKVPLMSHCRFCDVCVKQFDHHCHWINACIGQRNRRAFVLWLCCAQLYYTYTFLVSIILIVQFDVIVHTESSFNPSDLPLQISMFLVILVKVLIKWVP